MRPGDPSPASSRELQEHSRTDADQRAIENELERGDRGNIVARGAAGPPVRPLGSGASDARTMVSP